MIVVLRIEVNDQMRRTLRKAAGRGGMATRDEVRGIAELAIEQAFESAIEDAAYGRTEPK